ncbi:MAG: cytochrome c biogenesis CcdA family protein [Lachnospiraceae bacterium]|jgi:hypothetical protein
MRNGKGEGRLRAAARRAVKTAAALAVSAALAAAPAILTVCAEPAAAEETASADGQENSTGEDDAGEAETVTAAAAGQASGKATGIAAETEKASVPDDTAADATEEPVRMDYYYFNTCSACAPEEEFYSIVSEQIGDLKAQYPYVIQEHNYFQSGARAEFSEVKEELGLTDLPSGAEVLVIGGRAMVGLSEIRQNLRSFFLSCAGVEPETETAETAAGDAAELSSAQAEEQQSGEEEQSREQASAAEAETADAWDLDTEDSDSVIWLFTTLSCADCEQVEQLLDEIGDEITLADGTESRVVVKRTDITQGSNVSVLYALFDLYEVPDSQQQVPAVFYQNGWLTGADSIGENLRSELEAGKMQNLDAAVFQMAAGNSAGSASASAERLQSPVSLILTGLVNGLNPCGASMLLMLLAAVIAAEGNILLTGLSYLAGKMCAYFAMGLGLYRLFQAIDTAVLSGLNRVLTLVFAAVFFLLAILYVIDFVHVKREEYGKERMQLPKGLRKWNKNMIRRVSGVKASRLAPAVFALGAVISAGEFFCTGQVYLAEILYLMRSGTGETAAALSFVIYVAAMCVPSLILVLAVAKTGNAVRASNSSLKALPAVKLATAAAFAVFAVMMVLIG